MSRSSALWQNSASVSHRDAHYSRSLLCFPVSSSEFHPSSAFLSRITLRLLNCTTSIDLTCVVLKDVAKRLLSTNSACIASSAMACLFCPPGQISLSESQMPPESNSSDQSQLAGRAWVPEAAGNPAHNPIMRVNEPNQRAHCLTRSLKTNSAGSGRNLERTHMTLEIILAEQASYFLAHGKNGWGLRNTARVTVNRN